MNSNENSNEEEKRSYKRYSTSELKLSTEAARKQLEQNNPQKYYRRKAKVVRRLSTEEFENFYNE